MHHKPQPHHYELSRETNVRSILISIVVFAAIMFYFVVLRGRPFDLAYTNRAFAIGAVFLIGFSYILGPLSRIMNKTFYPKLKYRKPLGIYGYLFAVTHILMSFFVVPSEVLGANGLSLFFGMIAIIIFSFVAATSMVKSIQAFGFEKWQKIQRMGYLAFLLVILHFSVIEEGQFIGRELGQLTLVFATLVILLRILILFFKEKK